MKRWIFLTALCSAGAAWAQASAPSADAPSRAGASVACERAAQDTLQSSRPDVRGVSFNAQPIPVPGPVDANEVALRGTGRLITASGSRPFSYSCNYDVRARQVSGIVVRDAGSPAPQPAPRSVEPDLSNISPAACESSAAGALKRRWPAVSRIVFNSQSRQLTQDASGVAHLRGRGTAEPEVGSPATHFSYDCTLNARSGRVTGLQLGQ
jgi:hypothetical protein